MYFSSKASYQSVLRSNLFKEDTDEGTAYATFKIGNKNKLVKGSIVDEGKNR